MSITDNSSKVYVGSNKAIVRSLFRRVTIVWPSKRVASEFGRGGKESIFLLNSVPEKNGMDQFGLGSRGA